MIDPMNKRFFLSTLICWGVGCIFQCEAKTQMLFVTPDNCKLIKGYSKNDVQGVAQEFKVAVADVRYVKSEWGRRPDGGMQCNMVFSTPKGRKSCAVFSIIKDGFVFGQVVPVKGNNAICQ
jgi:hypothetical protein